MKIRHDMRRIPRATPPPRTARRIANARKAVESDKANCGLFPELARFQTADERLDHIDDMERRHWQAIRDTEAQMWRKVRRLVRGMATDRRQAFLERWNGAFCPAEACYALDMIRRHFPEALGGIA